MTGELISRKSALKKIVGIVLGVGLVSVLARNALADEIFRGRDGDGILEYMIYDESTGLLTLGKAGHIEVGGTVETDFKSKVTKKVNVGTPTNKMNTGSYGGILDANEAGVRTFTVQTASLSNPPTDAEIDGLLGAPASKAAGWFCFVEDTTDNEYWRVWTDGTFWHAGEDVRLT